LVLFVGLALIPMVAVLGLSFTRWDGIGGITFAGGENWRQLFADDQVAHDVWLSVQVMVLCWVVQTPISLLLGVYLAGAQRYRAFIGAILFLPLLPSSAAVAITWRNLVDPNFGLFSRWDGIPVLGVLSRDWLGDPGLALYTLIFVVSWQFIPFHTLLYIAGTRQIPRTLYEAAALDGAGAWRQFRSITLPQLRYTFITSTTLILVGSLTYLDLVFVLTRGGPGDATRILPLSMYITGFLSNQMGLASAVAVVLVTAGLALSLGLVKISGFGRMSSQQEGA
jgi:raffinose/stachyose/melibiose transport system permease protein